VNKTLIKRKYFPVFSVFFEKMPTFALYYIYFLKKFAMERNINRIKVVLVDKRKTNKWLSEQLGVSPTTVSKWCTNAAQPPLETLIAIANALEVPVQELVRQEEFNQEK
jgi:DNA-binding Xre family transcriptional regulator